MATGSDVIEKYIDARGGPADAALKAGPSVWFVIACLRTYNGDVKTVAYELDVPVKAVEAAMAYYEQSRLPIDARIEMNKA